MPNINSIKKKPKKTSQLFFGNKNTINIEETETVFEQSEALSKKIQKDFKRTSDNTLSKESAFISSIDSQPIADIDNTFKRASEKSVR